MFKTKKQILFLITGIIALVLVVNVALGYFLLNSKSDSENKAASKITKSVIKNTDIFSYEGESGIDALSILKRKTSVEQDKSGLVITINNRQVDVQKHEFWAFYVNGKFAEVGPKDYITKNTDKIEWKIDKY